jgi:hypothetical protein
VIVRSGSSERLLSASCRRSHSAACRQLKFHRIFKGELCETLAQLGGDSIDPDATDAPKVRAGECCEDGDHRDGGGHHLLIVAPRRRWLNDHTAASPRPMTDALAVCSKSPHCDHERALGAQVSRVKFAA